MEEQAEANNCVICERKTKYKTCTNCFTKIQKLLNDIPIFYALSFGEYWQNGRSEGSAGEQSIGMRISALDWRNCVTDILVLESWERDWREHLSTFGHHGEQAAMVGQRARKAGRSTATRSRDLVGVALCGVIEFLSAHLDAACQQHEAMDIFYSEILEIHGRGKAAAREESEQRVIIQCPKMIDDVRCNGKLVLTGEQSTCSKCLTNWDKPELFDVAGTTMSNTWHEIEVVAQYFGVNDRIIKRLVKQGLIKGNKKTVLWSSVVEYKSNQTLE